MKKITRASLKSFIKKNEKNLFVMSLSSFDGMVDCVMPTDDTMRKVESVNFDDEHSFGLRGLWLVGHSDDYFEAWEGERYVGIKIYNCCGSSIIATTK